MKVFTVKMPGSLLSPFSFSGAANSAGPWRFRLFLFIAFALSGFSSLVYEMAWMRELTLILGGTIYAVSAILSAFMVGLALGSLILGKLIDRQLRPLRIFAILELLIGLLGLSLTWLLPSLEDLFSLLYRYVPEGSSSLILLKFTGALSFLLLPTAAMGATFPALASSCLRSPEEMGGASSGASSLGGRLYAVNVAGAVLGAAFTGLFSLQTLGVSKSIALAVGINLSIGISAFWLSVKSEPSAARELMTHPREAGRAVPEAGSLPPVRVPILLALLALSGLTGMGYELLYARILIFIVGNSIYSLTLMLATFLAGMALGGYLGSRVEGDGGLKASRAQRARRDPWLLLAATQLGAGLAASLSLISLEQLPDLLPLGTSFWRDFGWRALISTSAMAPVAFFLGSSFPLALNCFSISNFQFPISHGANRPSPPAPRHSPLEGAGWGIGRFYAVHTLGSALGPLAAAFVGIPLCGIKGSILVLAALNLGIGILLVALHPSLKRTSKTLAAALPPAVAAAAMILATVDLRAVRRMESGNLLFYHEGRDGTVEVYRDKVNPSYRWLSINGATEVTIDYTSLQTFKVLGHLPLLLHPDPQQVLVVALGAGISLGAVTRHPVRSIDCVEISSGAVKALPFFERENYRAIRDKRLTLRIEDARSYLLGTPKRYDVILMDATHPSSADSWVLYTQEYYQRCRARLAPGGLIAQWLPLHQISRRDYLSILRTFRSVFPHTTLWCTYRHTILLGSPHPLRIDMARLFERMRRPEVWSSLGEVGLNHPFVLASCLTLGEAALDRLLAEELPAQINTDDRAPVQFSESRQYPRETRASNLKQILNHREGPLPYLAASSEGLLQNGWKEALARFDQAKENNLQGVLQMEEGEYASAVETFRGSLELVNEDADSLNLLSMAEVAYQQRERTDLLAKRRDPERRAEAVARLMGRGIDELQRGRIEEAAQALESVLELEPNSAEAHHYLGLTYLEKRELDPAISEWKKAVALKPDHGESHNFLAVGYYFKKQYLLAIAHCDKALELGYEVQPAFLVALQPYRR